MQSHKLIIYIQLLFYDYEPSILNDLQYYPNFVGNLDWEEYFTNYSSYIYLQDLSLTPENIEIVFDEIEKLSNLIDPNVNDGTSEYSIYGTPTFGESLSSFPDKSDPDGTQTSTYLYSWQTSSDNSTWNEVGSNYNYTLGSNDEGKFLKVQISYQDDDGFNEIATTSKINIPLLSFIFFSSNRWLPKFANPENMQFLEFNIVFLMIIFLISIFIFPLIKLVGKKRLSNFLRVSIVIICFISFFFEYSSSYSINLLKFFISIVPC